MPVERVLHVAAPTRVVPALEGGRGDKARAARSRLLWQDLQVKVAKAVIGHVSQSLHLSELIVPPSFAERSKDDRRDVECQGELEPGAQLTDVVMMFVCSDMAPRTGKVKPQELDFIVAQLARDAASGA